MVEYRPVKFYGLNYFSFSKTENIQVNVCNRTQSFNFSLPETYTHSLLMLMPFMFFLFHRPQTLAKELDNNDIKLNWWHIPKTTKRSLLFCQESKESTHMKNPLWWNRNFADYLIIVIAQYMVMEDIDCFFQYLVRENRMTNHIYEGLLYILKRDLKLKKRVVSWTFPLSEQTLSLPMRMDQLNLALNILPKQYHKELIQELMLPTAVISYQVNEKYSFLQKIMLDQTKKSFIYLFIFIVLNTTLGVRALSQYLYQNMNAYCNELTFFSYFTASILAMGDGIYFMINFSKIKNWEANNTKSTETSNGTYQSFKSNVLEKLKLLFRQEYIDQETQTCSTQYSRSYVSLNSGLAESSMMIGTSYNENVDIELGEALGEQDQSLTQPLLALS